MAAYAWYAYVDKPSPSSRHLTPMHTLRINYKSHTKRTAMYYTKLIKNHISIPTMAKLAVIVAILATLIAAASATTYTTVVTTSTEVDEKPEQPCRMEIQQMGMASCIKWMKTRRSGYEDSFLRSAVANPPYEKALLEGCCNLLRNVSPPCRCEAVRTMVRRIEEGHQVEEEAQPMVKQKAETLPRMCNWGSPSECRFRDLFI